MWESVGGITMDKLKNDSRESSELSDLVETYCKKMNIPYEKE